MNFLKLQPPRLSLAPWLQGTASAASAEKQTDLACKLPAGSLPHVSHRWLASTALSCWPGRLPHGSASRCQLGPPSVVSTNAEQRRPPAVLSDTTTSPRWLTLAKCPALPEPGIEAVPFQMRPASVQTASRAGLA